MTNHERKFEHFSWYYGDLITASAQVWHDYEPANERASDLIARFLVDIGASWNTRLGNIKLHRAMSDVMMAVRFSSTGLVSWGMNTTQYVGAAYSGELARYLRDCLQQAGHLTLRQRASKRDRLTRIYSIVLPQWLDQCQFKMHGIGPVVEVRSAKWRDDKGRVVGGKKISASKFADGALKDAMAVVRGINAMMQQFPLMHPNGQTYSRCRRIFNQGRLDKGGRFYGPWQNFSEETRLQMKIAGEPIVEIDLKACFLAIMCSDHNKKRGKPNPIQLPFDPYLSIPFVKECHTPERRKQMRNLAKLLISSMFSDKLNLTKFPKGIKSKTNKTGRRVIISVREQYQLPKGTKASAYYHQILHTFPFMHGANDKMFDLMYVESKIMCDAMVDLASVDGIPTYPVHDCLMCREIDLDKVINALCKAMQTHLKSLISLDVTYPDGTKFNYKAEAGRLVPFFLEGVENMDHIENQITELDDDFDLIET